mmetsp:Transcript_13039/g.18259  ORF Transcript_13039/g.18259 Transcript_13039/m.18259 type:complete len:113 (-) Transcript_13039:1149-1487(-)
MHQKHLRARIFALYQRMLIYPLSNICGIKRNLVHSFTATHMKILHGYLFQSAQEYNGHTAQQNPLFFSLSHIYNYLLSLGTQHHTQNFKSFTRHKFHLNHHITPNRSFMFFS